MQASHILAYYETMCSMYFDAAAIGISCAHVAEFMLERWWNLVPVVEVQQRWEVAP